MKILKSVFCLVITLRLSFLCFVNGQKFSLFTRFMLWSRLLLIRIKRRCDFFMVIWSASRFSIVDMPSFIFSLKNTALIANYFKFMAFVVLSSSNRLNSLHLFHSRLVCFSDGHLALISWCSLESTIILAMLSKLSLFFLYF